MEPTTTAILSPYASKVLLPVLKVALTKGLSLTWRKGSEAAKGVFQKLQADEAAKAYCEYAERILRVKTILDPNTVHSIPSIYHPLSARANKGFSRKIESFEDIAILSEADGEKVFVNLIGKAGQGKSTSFKFIFGKTLQKGEKLPLYFNLRDFGNNSIEDELFKGFGHFVSDIDIDVFKLLLQSQRVVIFLDGFDEVESSKRKHWLKEIDRLSIRYMVDILVSSRPDTEICVGVNVNNVFLCDLSKDDIESIIWKNAKDRESALEYISIVDENKNLEELLVSPILVMLFMSTYHMLDTIPDTVSRFYEEIFICLYKKHDKLDKPAFRREVKSSVIEFDAKDCFSAFCFLSFKNSDYGYSEESMRSYFRDALGLCGFDSNEADNIKSDILNITNLIVNDGYDRYSYIHRSIQEYYTARYIKELPDEKKISFYGKVVSNNQTRRSYEKVIDFLSDIDGDYFNKYLMIGIFELSGIVDLEDGSYRKMKKSEYRNLISYLSVDLIVSDDGIKVARLIMESGSKILSLDWVSNKAGMKNGMILSFDDLMIEIENHEDEAIEILFEKYHIDDISERESEGLAYKSIPVDEYLISLKAFDHFYSMFISTSKYLYEECFKNIYLSVKERDKRIESLEF